MAPKVFPKDSWEKTQYVPVKFRGLVQMLRPFTLLAPFFGGTFGALFALAVNGELYPPYLQSEFPFIGWRLDLITLFWGVATLMLLNAGSNTLNQITDLDIDKINKPYRPIPSGIVTVFEAKIAAVILYLLAMWRAIWVNLYFAMFVAILIIITILYSVEPIRFKKRLFVNNISIAIPRGMLGFVAAFCIFGEPFNPTPWIVGAIMALYLVGATTTKDFTDVAGDLKFGCRTLPAVFGKKKATLMSIPFFVLPFFIIPVAFIFGFLNGYSLFLFLIFVAWGTYIVQLLLNAADQYDMKFENSPAWRHMYMMLMAMQISFGIIYIV